jgi:hypothetical protein
LEGFSLRLSLYKKLVEPVRAWENIKHSLASYYLSGGCHWMARTLMLTLARLVEPDEQWHVRLGQKHSMVVNSTNTRVFDLLYWGLDGRLENYIYGADIKADDPSLGGRLAFESSAPNINNGRRRQRKKL